VSSPLHPNLLIIRSNKTKNKSQGDKYHHSVMLNTLHSDILRVLLNVLFCKSEPYYLERVSGSWREIVKKISLFSLHTIQVFM